MFDLFSAFIMHRNHLLYLNQHGFKKGHSSYLPLLDIQEIITASLEANKYSLGTFLDLAKAFDTVDHNILLAKLKYYGIRGLAISWLESYLQQRSQKVIFMVLFLYLEPKILGCHRGPILALLFLIYINDLPNTSQILHYILFCDSSNIFLSSPNLDALIQTATIELITTSDLFKANKL